MTVIVIANMCELSKHKLLSMNRTAARVYELVSCQFALSVFIFAVVSLLIIGKQQSVKLKHFFLNVPATEHLRFDVVIFNVCENYSITTRSTCGWSQFTFQFPRVTPCFDIEIVVTFVIAIMSQKLLKCRTGELV